MSKINDERIKLSVKSSNYHIASSFASSIKIIVLSKECKIALFHVNYI